MHYVFKFSRVNVLMQPVSFKLLTVHSRPYIIHESDAKLMKGIYMADQVIVILDVTLCRREV